MSLTFEYVCESVRADRIDYWWWESIEMLRK